MEKDLLSEVIEVEKEIQKCLELEKAASREWLEQAKNEFEEDYIKQAKTIEGSLQLVIEEAKREAEASASSILAQATRTEAQVAAMDSAALSKIVKKHISVILTG